MIHDIVCKGSCKDATVLGTCELSDDATQEEVAYALAPYLGESCGCGPAYRHNVSFGFLAPGSHPKKEHVDRYRNFVALIAEAEQALAKGKP